MNKLLGILTLSECIRHFKRRYWNGGGRIGLSTKREAMRKDENNFCVRFSFPLPIPLPNKTS
tara:strand:+ start:1277 stop:1462 length:186 start_codon:yes stop_codon:yes gene_type:complete